MICWLRISLIEEHKAALSPRIVAQEISIALCCRQSYQSSWYKGFCFSWCGGGEERHRVAFPSQIRKAAGGGRSHRLTLSRGPFILGLARRDEERRARSVAGALALISAEFVISHSCHLCRLGINSLPAEVIHGLSLVFTLMYRLHSDNIFHRLNTLIFIHMFLRNLCILCLYYCIHNTVTLSYLLHKQIS